MQKSADLDEIIIKEKAKEAPLVGNALSPSITYLVLCDTYCIYTYCSRKNSSL